MKYIKSIAPLVAYITVYVGLYVLQSAWAALLGFHLGLVLTIIIGRSSIPARTLIKGSDFLILMGCILLCASSGVMLYLAWPSLSAPQPLSADLAGIGLTSAVWPVFIMYFTLVNPWVEEYFWRCYLGNPSPNPAPVDFYYAGFHLLILYSKTTGSWLLISFLVLAGISWVWRQVYRKTGGLLIPVLSHMAADLSILIVVYGMSSWMAFS